MFFTTISLSSLTPSTITWHNDQSIRIPTTRPIPMSIAGSYYGSMRIHAYRVRTDRPMDATLQVPCWSGCVLEHPSVSLHSVEAGVNRILVSFSNAVFTTQAAFIAEKIMAVKRRQTTNVSSVCCILHSFGTTTFEDFTWWFAWFTTFRWTRSN